VSLETDVWCCRIAWCTHTRVYVRLVCTMWEGGCTDSHTLDINLVTTVSAPAFM
jgi:hypothetical protein